MIENKVYLIFGEEGSGKSTHAQLLAKETGLPYISSGKLVRLETEKQSSLGQTFVDSRTAYIDDELFIPFILNYLSKSAYSHGFVLEGFPRNLNQLSVLEDFFKTKNLVLQKAVYITLPQEIAIKRLLSRGRADDTPEKIKDRLNSFRQYQKEIVEKLKQQGKLVELENLDPTETVYARLRDSLGV